jgi:hypothetical protein
VNKYIQAIKDLDLTAVRETIERDHAWLKWAEQDGKNALHYLCGFPIAQYPGKAETSLKILKLLLKSGMDINSVHKIPDKNCDFPATPVWYAYTRGRNETLYTYLLRQGADPEHCMYAITWYDDARAARLTLPTRPPADMGREDDFQISKRNHGPDDLPVSIGHPRRLTEP